MIYLNLKDTLVPDWSVTTAGSGAGYKTTVRKAGVVVRVYSRTYTTEEAAKYGHSQAIETIKRLSEN